ncbi:uncharacterized protein BDR25DRAFT_347989 [Lindgomyces ingoldianus]|uniref:Uncharacterized protein n=1 Tax=Lindgomyces ingoldianus TaxID=673940 RepID=A0ACB6RE89_9PLEO|nr:uncharacterized protein BDR25DRAFT_347989 [Lindgomyces ingoldianus]KAF2477664.1 hypothetical protein BDR25DRAFT_347989 [Lindgomyces ingoldianus]
MCFRTIIDVGIDTYQPKGATQNYAGSWLVGFSLEQLRLDFILVPSTISVPGIQQIRCPQIPSGLLAYVIPFMNSFEGLAALSSRRNSRYSLRSLCLILLPEFSETVKLLAEREREAVLENLPKQAPTTALQEPNIRSFSNLDPPWCRLVEHFSRFADCDIQPILIQRQAPFTLVFIILFSLAFSVRTKRLSQWVARLGVEYLLIMTATTAPQSFFATTSPERIRAARGMTTADLAIGITNARC